MPLGAVGRGAGLADLGGGGEQVGIDLEEVDQGALGAGELGQSVGDGRFHLAGVLRSLVVVQLPNAEGGEPGEIEGAQVAGGEFGAQADEGGQFGGGLELPLLVVLAVPGEVEQGVAGAAPDRERLVPGVGGGLLGGEDGGGQAQEQAAAPPIRVVQMGVVELLDEFGAVASEVAPVVLVDEARGGDAGPGGQRPDLLQLFGVEGAVDGQELVVLVLAHGQELVVLVLAHGQEPYSRTGVCGMGS
ncbi:hypothetical protein DN051_37875 [Streptomyces cadmiisoli]|uniref:Uncharacterized protein n=1 Tax=Streptomyces cadmiisoli TaxID=2184053 RepID=A0A2Z4J9A2_9ACTN|nr:hypothetical protein DN051_37875 [Streptomyces cadmiisoli]